MVAPPTAAPVPFCYMAISMNMKSAPPAKPTHGVPKVNSVTVWFCDLKVSCTMSPVADMAELGE